MSELYNYCLRCHRKLKTLENRQRGYGDICWKKIKRKSDNRLFYPTNQEKILKNTLHK